MLLLLTTALAGCGGATDRPDLTATLAPHGGAAIALPDKSGYAEVVLEQPKTVPPRSGKVAVVAYFYEPDLASPLKAAPSDVRVSVNFPGQPPQTAGLAADPKTPGRFASPAGNLAVDPLSGEISFQARGAAVSQAFSNPR
jgi:hypothetical protein